MLSTPCLVRTFKDNLRLYQYIRILNFHSEINKIETLFVLKGALLAILIGHVTLPWRKWGESLLCVISLLQGALLLWMAQTNNIMVAYVGYVIIRTMYQVMITVAR